MDIKDGFVNKKVTIDTQDHLEEKIEGHMSMMSKLTTQDDNPVKPFKPKIYQSKRRGQTRKTYNRCHYGQRNYQNRYRPNSGDRRISFSSRIQYGQNTEIDQGMIKTIGMILEEKILEGISEQIRIIEHRIT